MDASREEPVTPYKPNRHQRRIFLGSLRRARRQAKKQRTRALKRGFGKVYDALVESAKAAA